MATHSVEQRLLAYEGQPITQSILMDLLKDYLRPHNKIREMEKKNLLAPVKRGLYITGSALNVRTPSVYLLANHIYGPSYISVEAALSYWGKIPEQVTTISSMTTGFTKTFSTPVGLFYYRKLPLPYYSYGIRMVESEKNQTILIASPEKALCDLLATRSGLLLRSISQTRFFLEEDLRIELDALRELDTRMMRSWTANAPKKTSINMLIKTLETL